MKISKILKILEKKFKINFWISLISITLLVGIISQLFTLSRYNAVLFFSWGQVVNDTIIFSFLVIAGVLGFLSYGLFLKVKPDLCEKWRGFLFIIYLSIIVSAIMGVLTFFTKSFNLYLVGGTIFYSLGYIYAISGAIGESLGKSDEKLDEKYWVFIIPSIYLIGYVSAFIFLLCLSIIFNNFIYQNIEIKINSKNHKINYMNDKYIFYSSGTEIKIIPNDGKSEFIIKGY